MELMFAEWEDGERFSFEDSDRFEEDSLCSFISEAESLCQNWRGWRKQSAGPNSPTVKVKGNAIHLLEFYVSFARGTLDMVIAWVYFILYDS